MIFHFLMIPPAVCYRLVHPSLVQVNLVPSVLRQLFGLGNGEEGVDRSLMQITGSNK